jgi:hypothetical protein
MVSYQATRCGHTTTSHTVNMGQVVEDDRMNKMSNDIQPEYGLNFEDFVP